MSLQVCAGSCMCEVGWTGRDDGMGYTERGCCLSSQPLPRQHEQLRDLRLCDTAASTCKSLLRHALRLCWMRRTSWPRLVSLVRLEHNHRVSMGSLCSKSGTVTGGHQVLGSGPSGPNATPAAAGPSLSSRPDDPRRAAAEAAERRQREVCAPPGAYRLVSPR